jgi:glycerophosphoryl diester phosphodiesterase
MHPFFTRSSHRVFAHRGGSGLAPENTLAAFDNGLALGADGLELDVHLSRDGVVVVHHDKLLDRTTDLRGAIAGRDAGELDRADAGYWFRQGDAFPFRGRRHAVPRLVDVLSRYGDIPIIIELKVNTTAMAEAVVRSVREAGASERVCIGSFGLRVLWAVRRLAPDIATSAAREEVRLALYRSRWGWPVRNARYDGYQVPELAGKTRIVSRRFVADAHAAGLGIQVWTVDAADDARRLLGYGVDALITDRPDIVVPTVKQLHL